MPEGDEDDHEVATWEMSIRRSERRRGRGVPDFF